LVTIEGPASSAIGATNTSDPEDRKRRRIRPGRVTGPQLWELYENNKGDWESEFGLWTQIDKSLVHLLGGTEFILPDNFLNGVVGRESMIVVFPQKRTTPLKICALLANKRPKAQRYAVGLGLTAEEVSTDVETWLEAVLEYDVDGRPLVPYYDIAGRALLEGAVVVKVLSSDAHWRKSLTWLDTLDEEEYDDLSKRKRRRYVPEADLEMDDDESDDYEGRAWTKAGRRVRDSMPGRYVRVDQDGKPVPKSRYHRDSRNRTRHHPYYKRRGRDGQPRKFEEDRRATRRAYQRDQKDWLARRLPFEVEVISARHCIPLMDDNERVEAILVVRQYDVEDLLAKDLIFGDQLPLLKPAYESGPVTVFELWHTDDRDRPYVAYFVDGFEYTILKHETDDGGIEQADAVIDLQREFGCSRLPIRWFWGLNFPIDGIHQKGVPFLTPVISSINAAEGLATATHIYAWRNAFAGSLIELNPALLEKYGHILIKNNELFKFETGPMENAVVPGKPSPNVTPPPGAGVQQLLQMLLQSAAAMSPSEAVFGGGSAPSGHDRALSKEYLEIALSQVLEAGRAAIAFISEMILEYAVWIAEKTGRAVPVYANTPTAQGQTKAGKPVQQRSDIIELQPSWLRSNTQIHAYFENDDTNEMERQQLAQDHMRGLVPWDEYRTKAWNDPAPEQTLAKIFGDQALRTPEGRQEVLEFARELWGDEQDQEKERLIQEGLLSPNGIPTEARVAYVPKRLQEAARLTAQSIAGVSQPQQGGLPPGVVPPAGVPADLAARHLQLDQSHAFVRGLEAPSGPIGPTGGPANAGGLPAMMPGRPPGIAPGAAPPGVPPGMAPGGPQGPPITLGVPPHPDVSLPPGVEGPADHKPYPPQFAAAPTLPGMGGSGTYAEHELAGVIAGQLERASRRYHERRKAQGGVRSGR